MPLSANVQVAVKHINKSKVSNLVVQVCRYFLHCIIFYILLHTAVCTVARGVTTAGDMGDASPVRPTMSPYIKMTTDSLSSELTFDE